MDDEIEIPEYFICPISLQIMRDPVTTITGITYDRESIERWISDKIKSKSKNKIKNASVIVFCPVTKLPLPEDSDLLTPNHTLRRLIQSWCLDNATRGVDRIPTPRARLEISNVVEMVKDLDSKRETVKKIEALAMESDRNRRLMVEAGVQRSMISFIVKSFNEGIIEGIEESLHVLHLIGVPSDEARTILMDDDRILESLTWILRMESDTIKIMMNRSYTIELLRTLTEHTSSHIVERLNPEVFRGILGFIRDVNRMNSNPRRDVWAKEKNSVIKQAVSAALMILLETSPWSRNRVSIIESGAVHELIELELNSVPTEKRTTELVLGVLSRLCSCAEGRSRFLAHQGSIATVTKRVFRISPAADDRAIAILNLVSKFSSANTVVQEMVTVGTVSKLCTVLQVDFAVNLKEKAKEILRVHCDEFKKFPCVDEALLTKLVSSSSTRPKA
ncbi:PREDICTED: E3 ubiquitin-protein ligase PUB24 [Tarenaya hassleriana]|uniref:E3 ubiquitin-protein ligase PUB24 n=1 Tax=Tarenaya hassleriana TaxID=28532 RepID=UPI00053C1D5D|nr:PREDICTED: E3 ubiquitin-protein ligase PUB24 [Tarenaya hassleriana]